MAPTSSKIPTVRQTSAIRSTRLTVVALTLALVALGSATSAQASSQPFPTAKDQNSTSQKNSSLPRLGDKGTAVRNLQTALVAQGIAVAGGIDGVFGPGTLSAVKTFQTARGLVANGEVNVTTAFLLGLGPTPPLPARGQRGTIVTALQQALVNAGIEVPGGIDGIFGAGTTRAVVAYQKARGLDGTGKVDTALAINLGIVEGSVANSPNTTPPATTPPTTVVAPPATDAVDRFTAVGDTGDAVKSLQKALIAAGVTVKGGADGRFGAATTSAITTYQRNVRLPATGIVDLLTTQLLGLRPGPTLPKLGDSGDSVTTMQNLLLTAGIAVKGGADGRFGSGTKSAITTYQKSQSLIATGVLDLRTALYLGFVAGAVTSTTPPSTSPTTTTAPPTTPPTTPPTSGAPAVTATVFPVLGPCWFADTWKAPRSGGRQHEGVDIIAKTGTPIYAVANGTITRQFFDRPGSLGGNAVRLTAADGTYFHYAHLSAFAESAALGATVVAGQVIGYVGNTGSSSTPHLHFEYHPGGGAATNPYLIVKPLDACQSTVPPTTIPATTIPVTTIPVTTIPVTTVPAT